MSTRLSKLLRLPRHQRRLLLEAAAWLAVARLAVVLLPFRWLAPFLGRTEAESPETDPREPEILKRVAWAVRVADRNVPWTNRCLAEAIAGKALLRRREVPSTLYLGLTKNGDGELEAHAWLRCGSRILTGEEAREGFTVIAKFAEEPPR